MSFHIILKYTLQLALKCSHLKFSVVSNKGKSHLCFCKVKNKLKYLIFKCIFVALFVHSVGNLQMKDIIMKYLRSMAFYEVFPK